MNTEYKELANFEKWWNDEGSAMRPLPKEDQYEHVRRISKIAWENGTFKALEVQSYRIPVLSIKQPWAWLIVHGHKDIENRSWKTNIRGPILIHAGKSETDKDLIDWGVADIIADREGVQIPPFEEYERGGLVGSAEIVDCVTDSESPWFFGKYGFVLENARPLPFKKCRGKLGFFYL